MAADANGDNLAIIAARKVAALRKFCCHIRRGYFEFRQIGRHMQSVIGIFTFRIITFLLFHASKENYIFTTPKQTSIPK